MKKTIRSIRRAIRRIAHEVAMWRILRETREIEKRLDKAFGVDR